MSLLELAEKRESCRCFSEKPVDRRLIDLCLEAARLAPSACNAQPWSFIVLDHAPEIRSLLAPALTGVYRASSFILDAPVLIVVETRHDVFITRLGGMWRGVQYSLIDIGIACQHLVLQAAELGLASCWVGWFNGKKLKQSLKLPKSARIDVVLALGYKGEQVGVRPKIRKALSEIRRFYSEEENR
jgi:nitroreductase